MDIVILAAGLGSRLKNFTKDRPKAMVEVAGKTLIDHAFNFIDLTLAENVYVIGGYEINVLKNHLKNKNSKVKIIENPDYKQGSTLTIEKAIPFLKDDFLLMNVDHIYPKEMFKKIIENKDADKIIAMTDSDRKLGDDDMKVELNSDKTIKNISKKLTDFQLGYIGMTYIGKNMLKTYLEGLNTVIEKEQGKANVEAVLDYLSKSIKINVLDLSNLGWHEVDTPEERSVAEKVLLDE